MNLMDLIPDTIRDGLLDGMSLVALAGGVKFLMEYIRDNRRKRLQLYGELRKEFRTNPHFSDIFEGLDEYDTDDALEKAKAAKKLAGIRQDTRSEFAAFLEDVAMTMKAGALKKGVANYMFGYYAILCWETEPFWTGLRRCKADPYWALLNEFVHEMKGERKTLETSPSRAVAELKV
jgi:hypothetical protein